MLIRTPADTPRAPADGAAALDDMHGRSCTPHFRSRKSDAHDRQVTEAEAENAAGAGADAQSLVRAP